MQAMREEGYQHVYSLAGGLFRWQQRGQTLVSEGEVTQTIHPYSDFFAYFMVTGNNSFTLPAQQKKAF